MAILASDTFSRANQTGFGTASDGESWSKLGGGGAQSIASNKGAMTNSTGLVQMVLGSKTLGDLEIKTHFTLGASGDYAFILAHITSSTISYRLRATGTGLTLQRTSSGTTTLGTYATTLNAGTLYWLDLKIINATLYCTVWADGSAQPAYQITATDATPLASGTVGVGASGAASTDIVTFDNFTADNLVQVAANNYGVCLNSGGTPNAAGSLMSTSNTYAAILDCGANRVRWQVPWNAIERAVQTTVPGSFGPGTVTLTPAAMLANFVAGVSFLLDTTPQSGVQETVTLSSVTGSTITFTCANAHGAGSIPIAAIPSAGDTPGSSGSPARVNSTYDWSVFDDMVITCNTNNQWCNFVIQNAPTWHTTPLAIDATKNVPVASDAAAFATACMQRAIITDNARIAVVEVANEGFNTGALTSANASTMFTQMYNLISAVRTAVKAVFAETLMGSPAELNPATTNISAWINGFFAANCHTLVDYCNFHFYPTNGPDNPTTGNDSLLQWIAAWQAALTANSSTLPVHITETGYTMSAIGDTTYNQYMTSTLTEIAGTCVKVLYWYDIDSTVPSTHFNDGSTHQTYKTWKNAIAANPYLLTLAATYADIRRLAHHGFGRVR